MLIYKERAFKVKLSLKSIIARAANPRGMGIHSHNNFAQHNPDIFPPSLYPTMVCRKSYK